MTLHNNSGKSNILTCLQEDLFKGFSIYFPKHHAEIRMCQNKLMSLLTHSAWSYCGMRQKYNNIRNCKEKKCGSCQEHVNISFPWGNFPPSGLWDIYSYYLWFKKIKFHVYTSLKCIFSTAEVFHHLYFNSMWSIIILVLLTEGKIEVVHANRWWRVWMEKFGGFSKIFQIALLTV